MNRGNTLVLAASLLAAVAMGVGVAAHVPDAGAGISAALLGGLTALMLGGWLSARAALAR